MKMLKYTVFPLILLAFFFSSLFLVIGIGDVFNSPDESANAFFAESFSETGTLHVYNEQNAALHGILHPRSIVSLDGYLVPVSFHGLMVLAGIIRWLFGDGAMVFVTPVLAVLGILAWRTIVRRLFDDEWLANAAALLLLLHPAFWYYAGRVMMHNVGFISLTLLAFAWFLERPLSRRFTSYAWRYVDLFCSAGFLVFAIVFRISEALWVVPLFVLLFFTKRAEITWKHILVWSVSIILFFLPFLFLNSQTYHAVFVTGYQVEGGVDISVFDPEFVATTPSGEQASSILPFGFAPRAMAIHVWQYIFALYPWMFIPAALGFFLVLQQEKNRRWFFYHLTFLMISTWLVLLYGSWVFNDNPDPNVYSLGNSYVRYWLPMFVLSTVYAAYAIRLIGERLFVQRASWKRAYICFVFIFIALLSGRLVFFGHDGFVPTRAALFQNERKQEQVLSLVPEDGIVIVDRADKFIFPHRNVITPLRSDLTYAAMPQVVREAPLYYFGITLPEQDMNYLNEVKFADNGLEIRLIETIENESLYRIDFTTE